MIRVSIIFILVFNVLIIQSQNTTSRLTIQKGGSVNFYFDTFDEYTNGITYTDFTQVSVYFLDTLDDGSQNLLTTWKLEVEAMNNNIDGTLSNLPLNTIEIEASFGGGGGPAPTFPPVFALSQIKQPLVTGGPQVNLIAPQLKLINITFHCGKSLTVANSLLGSTSDFYSVDIMLTLGPE